jgi:hypothetical protein
MMIAIPAAHWEAFTRCSDAELAGVLKDLAQRMDLKRYPKHKRGPKKPPPKRSAYKNGAHVATAKILASRKTRK